MERWFWWAWYFSLKLLVKNGNHCFRDWLVLYDNFHCNSITNKEFRATLYYYPETIIKNILKHWQLDSHSMIFFVSTTPWNKVVFMMSQKENRIFGRDVFHTFSSFFIVSPVKKMKKNIYFLRTRFHLSKISQTLHYTSQLLQAACIAACEDEEWGMHWNKFCTVWSDRDRW